MPSEQPDHLNIRLQIDAIADQYEKSSAAETDPERRAATIRQLLQYNLSLPQAALLLELLSIELERAVPEPQLRSLFPDHSDVVEQVIQHEKRAAQGFDPGPPTVISAPVAESSEPLPVIPGYELRQCIGRGGMGAVYRAIQHGTRKTVAVKTILAKWSGNDRAVKRFENECLAAARLDNHPHMARVLELGECPDGQRFYAMDYIEGQNLKQRIQLACDEVSRHRSVSGSKRDTPAAATDSTLPAKSADQEQSASEPANRIYPNADFLRTVASEKQSAGGHRAFEQAVRIGIDAADALAYAHEAGIVHRDIKPANLLLDQKTGHVVVADFGLAQITEHQLTQAITNPGEVMGTYGYMSPEQLLGNRVVVDSLTDVFSLGATLYELLTLQPIRRGTDAEIMRAIAFEDPVKMRKLVPAIPEDLETIIHAAIASRPQDRYQSMARFRDDLQRWLDRKPIQARPPGLLKRASLWVERNQKLSAVISSAVLVILFILGVAWRIQAQQTLVQSRLKDEQQELKEEAIAQSKENKSLYLVASSHLERDNDPTLATLLAIEAQKLHKSPEATAALVMAMRENHEVRSWNVRDADVREGHMVVHPDMTSVVTTVSYTELQSEHTNLPAVESDVAAGRVIHQYDTGGVVIGAEWSNDGKKLLLCSAQQSGEDGKPNLIELTFQLWTRQQARPLEELLKVRTTIGELESLHGQWPMGFSPDSTQIAIADDEQQVRRFRGEDGQSLSTLTARYPSLPIALAWTPTTHIAVLTKEHQLLINDKENAELIVEFDHSQLVPPEPDSLFPAQLVALSDTRFLVSKFPQSAIFELNIRDGRPLLDNIQPNEWRLVTPTASTIHNLLSVTTIDGRLLSIDSATLLPLADCTPFYKPYYDMILPAPDSRHVALLAKVQNIASVIAPLGSPGRPSTIIDNHVIPFHLNGTIADAIWVTENQILTLCEHGKIAIWATSPPNVYKLTTQGQSTSNTTFQINSDSTSIVRAPVTRRRITALRTTGQELLPAVDGSLWSAKPNLQRLSIVANGRKLRRIAVSTGDLSVTQELAAPAAITSHDTTVDGTTILVDEHDLPYEWPPDSEHIYPVLALRASTPPACSPLENIYALGTTGGNVHLRRPLAHQQQLSTKVSDSPIVSVCFSPDGQLLATFSEDRKLSLLERSANGLATKLTNSYPQVPPTCTDLCFSSDSSRLLLFSHRNSGGLASISTESLEIKALHITETQIQAADFGNSDKIVFGTSEGLYVWAENAEPELIVNALVKSLACVNDLAFVIHDHPTTVNERHKHLMAGTGNTLFSYNLSDASGDSPKQITDVEGVPIRLVTDSRKSCLFIESLTHSLEFGRLPKATFSANAPDDRDVKFLPGPIIHNSNILYSGFLPESDFFVTVSRDGTVKTWDPRNNSRISDMKSPTGPITQIASARAHDSLFLCTEADTLLRCNLPRGSGSGFQTLNVAAGQERWQNVRLFPSPDGNHLAYIANNKAWLLPKISSQDKPNKVRIGETLPEELLGISWDQSSETILLYGNHRIQILRQITQPSRVEETSTGNLRIKHATPLSADRILIRSDGIESADRRILILQQDSTHQDRPWSIVDLQITNVADCRIMNSEKVAVDHVGGALTLLELNGPFTLITIPPADPVGSIRAVMQEPPLVLDRRHKWIAPFSNAYELWPLNPFESVQLQRNFSQKERLRFHMKEESSELEIK